MQCHYLFISHAICLFIPACSAAIPVTIGMRQSLYYVNEDAGSLTVCYEVLSGSTAERSINMQLRTVEGDAKGSLVHTLLASCMNMSTEQTYSDFINV